VVERRRQQARPRVEALEDRCVPATVTRPIMEFVDAQGTFCIDDGAGGCFLFVPPVANFFGWTDPKQELGVSVDYAGLADDAIQELSGGDISFDTTFSGQIVERPLPDGRAEILVTLHTRNALTWAINWDPADPGNPFGDNPLLFGARVTDVLEGAAPALGESFLQVKFINDHPGDPMPDLQQLFREPEPGQEVIGISFRARADGELREEFGVPDGTPGRVEVTQTGIFQTSFQGATADGFPAERITLRATGSGVLNQGGLSAIDLFFEEFHKSNGKSRNLGIWALD
jgi:hypothetical protein